jgi:hypothetical protein
MLGDNRGDTGRSRHRENGLAILISRLVKGRLITPADHERVVAAPGRKAFTSVGVREGQVAAEQVRQVRRSARRFRRRRRPGRIEWWR